MSNILEGPNPDEMKPGDTYKLVSKGETKIGETRLALEKVEDATTEQPHMTKLVIELPQNAHAILKELSEIRGMTVEEGGREMIYALIQSDLTGCTGDIGESLAKYLCRKYNYNPEAWREEAS